MQMEDQGELGNKCFFDKKYEQALGYYSEAIVSTVSNCVFVLYVTNDLTIIPWLWQLEIDDTM